MPTTLEILEQLKRDELIQAVERFELEVSDKRQRGLLIDALASSDKVATTEVLGGAEAGPLEGAVPGSRPR